MAGFNQEQQQALAMVGLNAAVPAGITVVQGPPGTGKSHLIAKGFLQQLPELGSVLVLCLSNAAVDSLLEKLISDDKSASKWAARVGPLSSVTPKVAASGAFVDGPEQHQGFPTNCKKRVVFTTLYQASKLQTKDGKLPSWSFDTVIFDEASQVRDTDVVKVIAKCNGSLKRKRVYLLKEIERMLLNDSTRIARRRNRLIIVL